MSIPITSTSGHQLLSSQSVHCPVCGGEWIHIGPVGVHQNELFTFVTAKNETLDPNAPSSGRGSAVYLNFSGECGHTFTIRYSFHKGETIAEVFRGEDLPEGELGPSLWRD